MTCQNGLGFTQQLARGWVGLVGALYRCTGTLWKRRYIELKSLHARVTANPTANLA